MAALHHHHHQIKAPTPTWLIGKATPPPRDGTKKLAAAVAAAYSPLLLSPSVWQKAQDAKKSKADGGDGALPASPRITCMGQVKGRPRRCSGARRGDRPATRGSSGLLERLMPWLFGRRRRGRTSSRACSKVRDVPSCSSASSRGKSYCGGGGAAAVCTLDPPLPVVRRPAADDDAPTLWERRRGGGGKALETLRLT
uniref:Uncharacterized protein n=1 Tax=Oryza punctata TaxID=4537 RepID=A0A0E0KHX8_ORYPU